MWNYLFEIIETGEPIFVQCDDLEEVEDIMKQWGITMAELEYQETRMTDEEAEWYGYDTY